ncbi:Short-chain alcohol dehydrogenase precursor [Sphingobium herbicidovorans NBRC 16415]|uniref:Short-chain alcohol dehydrogenase n=1 Tax=Sphingobium herbicidovorans (strain ATCC 700291 / DSM 11019 / CCUG 56400 / KCTC 2939 / LMG 18315 / NBRC 16415 / MH) TaxID=1219045 RepID=A0A086P629_SPHHM|nr:SDR family NAD(P)-dependent oxidoreductase [Sphingobium herbicidovorans]KFG88847.1 Short-chain alcohol dehydrogenase precursor [Sphingobium herbicidovorans NBRC 16415]
MKTHAIVTGAAGVLGQAVTQALVAAGYRVTGIDRAADAGSTGPNAYLGGVDLSDPAAAAKAIDQAIGANGPVVALVNVAGTFRWETVADGDVATWATMFDINLRTAVNAVRAALPSLREGGGAIVSIGAASAVKAAAGMGAYAASKAGIAKLTEALADEEKDNGVRVNAVLPSIIDTPANRSDMAGADFSRWVSPAQVASVIAFLLSDSAAAVTGACIPVTGRC